MIKVLSERHYEPDMQPQLKHLLVELESKVIQEPGYISGETFKSIDSPSTLLTVGIWESLNAWEARSSSSARRKIVAMIEVLLLAPEKISVFQALAAIRGQDYVIPDDVKYLAVPALANRALADLVSGHKGTFGRSSNLLYNNK